MYGHDLKVTDYNTFLYFKLPIMGVSVTVKMVKHLRDIFDVLPKKIPCLWSHFYGNRICALEYSNLTALFK